MRSNAVPIGRAITFTHCVCWTIVCLLVSNSESTLHRDSELRRPLVNQHHRRPQALKVSMSATGYSIGTGGEWTPSAWSPLHVSNSPPPANHVPVQNIGDTVRWSGRRLGTMSQQPAPLRRACCGGPWVPVVALHPPTTVTSRNTGSASQVNTRVPKLSRLPTIVKSGTSHRRQSAGLSTTNSSSSSQYPPTTLPLFSETIPVEGTETPGDGCERNEILTAGAAGSRTCERLLRTGPCGDHWWVVVNRTTNRGECRRRQCEIGMVFVESDGRCHDPDEPQLCPEDRQVYVNAYGEAGCGCEEDSFLDTKGSCRRPYDKSICPANQQLLFNTRFQLHCAPRVCPHHSPVLYQNRCTRFGEICDRSTNSIIAMDSSTLGIICATPAQVRGEEPPPGPEATRVVRFSPGRLLCVFSVIMSQHRGPLPSLHIQSHRPPLLTSTYLPPLVQQPGGHQPDTSVCKTVLSASLTTSPSPDDDVRKEGESVCETRAARSGRSLTTRSTPVLLSKCRPGSRRDDNFKCRTVITGGSTSKTKKRRRN